MKDIVVLARTQRIVVNPMSRAVSIVNAGPVGPAGVAGSTGGLTEEQTIDAVATSVVAGDNIDVTYDDTPGTITVAFKPEAVEHNWDSDGWTPFTDVLINDDVPLGNSSSQTKSVVAGRGRVTNSNTQGSMRFGYARDDTLWMDSEITSLQYGADVFNTGGTNPATPQGGHFHRGYFDVNGVWRAIVVDNNIALSDVNVVNGNVWNKDPSQTAGQAQFKQGSGLEQKTYSADHLQRALKIVAVDRFIFGVSINEYHVIPENRHGVTAGTEVTVTVSLDSTFAVASATAIGGVGPGLVSLTDAEAGAAVGYKVESGIVLPTQASARRYWPYWIKSRLIGSKLWIKVWRHKDPEPDWSNTDAVFDMDFAGANLPTPNALMPVDPGYCGLIGAHIRNTRYLEFGRFSCKKL